MSFIQSFLVIPIVLLLYGLPFAALSALLFCFGPLTCYKAYADYRQDHDSGDMVLYIFLEVCALLVYVSVDAFVVGTTTIVKALCIMVYVVAITCVYDIVKYKMYEIVSLVGGFVPILELDTEGELFRQQLEILKNMNVRLHGISLVTCPDTKETLRIAAFLVGENMRHSFAISKSGVIKVYCVPYAPGKDVRRWLERIIRDEHCVCVEFTDYRN